MKYNYSQLLKRITWDIFGTVTTRFKLTMNAARNAMDRLLKFLESKFKKLQIFWICEEYELIKGCHIHMLIKCDHEHLTLKEKIMLIDAAWKFASGNKKQREKLICHFRKFKPETGGEEYVTKHILNNWKVDYDFLGDW
jgi:hypothetical protein